LNNKYLAFDIDGTIFSSENILYPSYELSVDEFNKGSDYKIIVPSEKSIFNLVGKPSKEIYKELFPEFTKNDIDIFAKLLRTSLVKLIFQGKGIYYDNIIEIIKELSEDGYKIIAASNGSLEYVSAVLKYAGLYEIFEAYNIVVIDHSKNIFTKGDILESYQNRYKFKSEDCIMIGDRTSDINASKQINCPFIGTLYGHGNNSEIEKSTEIIENTDQLILSIRKIFLRKQRNEYKRNRK